MCVCVSDSLVEHWLYRPGSDYTVRARGIKQKQYRYRNGARAVMATTTNDDDGTRAWWVSKEEMRRVTAEVRMADASVDVLRFVQNLTDAKNTSLEARVIGLPLFEAETFTLMHPSMRLRFVCRTQQPQPQPQQGDVVGKDADADAEADAHAHANGVWMPYFCRDEFHDACDRPHLHGRFVRVELRIGDRALTHEEGTRWKDVKDRLRLNSEALGYDCRVLTADAVSFEIQ